MIGWDFFTVCEDSASVFFQLGLKCVKPIDIREKQIGNDPRSQLEGCIAANHVFTSELVPLEIPKRRAATDNVCIGAFPLFSYFPAGHVRGDT